MKLLVIVICLIGERFLVHSTVHQRFSWFKRYCSSFRPAKNATSWLRLASLIIPPLGACWLLLYFFGAWLFGFIGLIFSIIIFHHCLGPDNPFYPNTNEKNQPTLTTVGSYLATVNGQLFAVIFWYLVLGPVGVLAYRMIALSQEYEGIEQEAGWLTDIMDWVPAKITAMLYLLVGNFHRGFAHFSRLFLAAPEHNQTMLTLCGLEAVSDFQQEPVLMPRAEILVENALILLLVFIALFTIAAWL